MTTFKQVESAAGGTTQPLAAILDALAYNDQGLVAAVAQDAKTRQVVMMAWMDRTALERTLAEGYACYYSRSRKTYWQKGESSGHVQKLVELRFDCDGDAILLLVEQTGPACHTDRDSCFYLLVEGQRVRVTEDPG